MWFHILAQLHNPKNPGKLPKPESISRPDWLQQGGKRERKIETDPLVIAAWFQEHVG